MEFGWYGDRDIAAAVTYLQTPTRCRPQRIGAVGMSMGGEEAIGAMAADPRIKATVAEGATNRVFADTTWLADEYGLRGVAQLGIEWLTYRLADVLTAALPPTSLADAVQAAAPRPILLIAAGNVNDEQVVAEQAALERTWQRHRVGRRWRRSHRWSAPQPEQWTLHVTDFLDAALNGDRSPDASGHRQVERGDEQLVAADHVGLGRPARRAAEDRVLERRSASAQRGTR